MAGVTFLKACAAWLFFLSVYDDMICPPVILLCGAKPRYEVKSFFVGNFDMSVPTSAMTCSMALA
jgi:hypothetical protein